MTANIILWLIVSLNFVQAIKSNSCKTDYQDDIFIMKCINVTEDLEGKMYEVFNIYHIQRRSDYILFIENSNFTTLNNVPGKISITHVNIINNLEDMDEDAFSELKSINSLSITGSNMLIYNGFISNAWYFNKLNLTNNNIHQISKGSLCKPKSYKIIIKNNKISTLEDAFNMDCSYLEYLDASYNNLPNLNLDVILPFDKLQTLDFSFNQIH